MPHSIVPFVEQPFSGGHFLYTNPSLLCSCCRGVLLDWGLMSLLVPASEMNEYQGLRVEIL